MFRPSSSLMFRPMPALNKLRIHHPLPLSQRESAQLLNLLTTSFRHNLDTEHPSFRTPDNAPRISKTNNKSRRRSFSDSEQHPTDRHMHSMLTNPLFALSPNHKISPVSRDPMELFDLAVANGMMDTNHAKLCLKAKKDRIIRSPVPSIRDGMEESGAGMKVIRWLISSGTSMDNQFLKDQDFATLLMEFMVAEGLQEQAWKWIKRSFQKLSTVSALPAGEASTLARREIAGPLRALVRAELEHNISFDAAYMCMSRAAGYLNGVSSPGMTTALQPAGLILLNQTCMPKKVTHPPPTESSFESFVSLVPIINPRRTHHYLAHLSVLHPTKPDASLALDYLQTESSDENIKFWVLQPANKKSSVIQLGLDTAKLLLEQNRHAELEWTMSFLSRNFPEQLGIKQKRQLDQVKAEASSIELLSSLGIA